MGGPNPYEFKGFEAMDGPKPYKFIGCGAMDGRGARLVGWSTNKEYPRGCGYIRAAERQVGQPDVLVFGFCSMDDARPSEIM